MNHPTSGPHRECIGFTEFISKFIPFTTRIPFVIYHMITGLNTVSGKKNISWGLMLEKTAAKYPHRTAVKSSDGMLTYGELNENANRFAHFLKSRHVAKGDTVTVCMETRPELLALYCGCAKIGAICSLINTNQRGDSLIHSINLNKGKVIVIGEECLDFVKEVEPALDTEGPFVCYIKDPLINTLNDKDDITDLLSTMPPHNLPETAALTVKDPVAYVYTSGTTGGLPKAAVITNKRVVSAMFWWGGVVASVKPKHTIYVPLPFFHTNALTVGWAMALFGGAAMAIRRKFSASRFLNDIKQFNVTHFVYIGEVCRYLMAQPDEPSQEKTKLKYVIGNGLRPDIWRSFKKRYGLNKIYEFYGASEGVGILTNIMNFEFCVGMSLTPKAIVKYDIENDCLVRDDQGRVQKVKKGEYGLCLMQISEKTPFAGYSDKQKTKEKIIRNAFKEGDMWFNTGDLLRNMGYGQAQFVDRLGDTFRWKGENVATLEVEKACNSFKGVEAATVYGVGLPVGDGKAGMAAIIKERGEDVDLEALPAHLESQLPKYAVPLFLRFVEDFEWTATHKVKKIDLKDQGFDPGRIENLYVLLPGHNRYAPMTYDVYQDIIKGEFLF